jgi:hypothetical protein
MPLPAGCANWLNAEPLIFSATAACATLLRLLLLLLLEGCNVMIYEARSKRQGQKQRGSVCCWQSTELTQGCLALGVVSSSEEVTMLL